MTTPAQETALAKAVARTVYFAEFQMRSGTAYVSSWNAPYYWGTSPSGIGAIATPPALAFDFVNSPSLTPYVGSATLAVTRAGATATRGNAAGLIEIVGANLPRFDYDPATLLCKGLLIEEARTNRYLYSSAIDNAAWAKTNLSVVADTTDTLAPDGLNTAEKLTTTSTGSCYFSQAATGAVIGDKVAHLVYAKKGTSDRLIFELHSASWTVSSGPTFDLTNGTKIGGLADDAIVDAGNGWYRCSATRTAAVNNPGNAMFVDGYGTAVVGRTIYVWGVDAQVGAFVASHIPTAGAAVTRNADQPIIASLGAWFNAAASSYFAEWIGLPGPSGNPGNARILGLTSPKTPLSYNGSPGPSGIPLGMYEGAAPTIPSGTYTTGTIGRLASAYTTPNDAAISFAGGAIATSANANFGVPTAMYLGHQFNNTLHINGHLRRFTYYNTRLANADLVTLSRLDQDALATTWVGLGSLGGVSPIEEADSLDAKSLSFTLNLAQPEWKAIALGDVAEYRGRPAKLYFCPLDDNGKLIDTPQICWRGVMDAMSLGIDGEEGSITLKCETSAYGLKRRASMRVNAAQQKKKYPNDTGLDYLTSLIAQPQVWLSKRFQER